MGQNAPVIEAAPQASVPAISQKQGDFFLWPSKIHLSRQWKNSIRNKNTNLLTNVLAALTVVLQLLVVVW